MIRVLIADDQPLVRQGLRMLLSVIPGLEVSGEAGNGEEAVNKARQLQPQLIIMDAQMPRRDGFSATVEILERSPETLIIIISIESGKELQERSQAAGAFAFAEKSSGQVVLLREVRRAIDSLVRS